MRWIRSEVLLCALAAASCAAPRAGRPIDVRSYESALLPEPEPGGPDAEPAAVEAAVLSAPELTLEGAVAVALAHRPDLAAAEAAIDVASAARIGAMLYPNPEASLTVERDGAESAVPQLWLELSQPIVLSDRRRLGGDEADANAAAATWELFQRRVEAVERVRIAWYETAAAQAAVAISQDGVGLAEELQRVAEIRLAAEVTPEIEVLRAKAEVERAKFDVEAAQADLAAVAARLASAMGVPDATLPPCPALPPDPPSLPSTAALDSAAVDESFAVRAARARVRAAELAADLAEAQAIPDLTVTAGYGQSIDPAASLWTVGLGVPLPVFDRNQGARAEADARRILAEADVAAAEAEVRTTLREAAADYAGASARLRAVRESAAPLAEETWRRAEIAYREGSADYLSLLDAKRALAELRIAELEALLGAWLAVVRIETLVGPLAGVEVQP